MADLRGPRGRGPLFDTITGTPGDDDLVGSNGADSLDGAGGDDTLMGGFGNDTLLGGSGSDILHGQNDNDELFGGSGDDILRPGSGADVVDGGGGIDRATFNLSGASGVLFDASGFTSQSSQTINDGNGINTVVSVERVSVLGTAFDDTIIGTGRSDALAGEAGDNRLSGRGGDDTLSATGGVSRFDGGHGEDLVRLGALGSPPTGVFRIDGGEGADTVELSAASVAPSLSGGLKGRRLILRNQDGSIDLAGTGIEAVGITSGSGDDTLFGGAFADVIDAGEGSNRVSGQGGDDTLAGGGTIRGGSGDDTVSGFRGSRDRIDAGEGRDLYVYDLTLNSPAQTIDLSGFDPGGVNRITDAGGARDFVSGAEGVGITAGSDNDSLTLGAGDDVLDGGFGSDTIFAGNGDDVLANFAAGYPSFGLPGEFLDLDDVFDGGAGIDTLDYSDGVRALTIRLARHSAEAANIGEDTVRRFEIVLGGFHHDFIAGDEKANTLAGGGGDDRLFGGDGDDVLIGGAGGDKLAGGAGGDVFRFLDLADSAQLATADRITDLQAADQIDLSAIDADTGVAGDQAFVRVADLTGEAGQLAVSLSGGSTWVLGDVDGDARADFILELDGDRRTFDGYQL